MDQDGYIVNLPPGEDPPETNEPGTMRVSELGADGTWKHSVFHMPQSLIDSLDRAQAEYQRLDEAGTPYWCHCDQTKDEDGRWSGDGRSVTHPRAYWRDDAYDEGDPGYDGIHRKHGVLCADCGGYIQEG